MSEPYEQSGPAVFLVRRHAPNFMDVADSRHEDIVQSFDDLMKLDYVNQWKEMPGFDRWAYSPNGSSQLLIAIMRDAHWVVAYVWADLAPYLPKF